MNKLNEFSFFWSGYRMEKISTCFESDRRRMGIFWRGYNGPELRLIESLNHGFPGAICAHLKEDARMLG